MFVCNVPHVLIPSADKIFKNQVPLFIDIFVAVTRFGKRYNSGIFARSNLFCMTTGSNELLSGNDG